MSVLATWSYQIDTDAITCAVRCNNKSEVTEAVVPNTYTTGGVTYPVTRINSVALSGCPNLTKVEIPASIVSIGNNAFGTSPNLTRVDYKGTIAQWCDIDMGDNDSTPFKAGASLYVNDEEVIDVVIPKTVTTIKSRTFYYYSKLRSVVIENRTDNITQTIGYRAFANCSSLTGITLSDSLSTIGEQAVMYCVSLKRILIPEGVGNIGNSAFSYCSNLAEVLLTATTPPTVGTGIFNSTSANLQVYCYMTSLSAYQSATNWKTYKDKMIADDLRIYFVLNASASKNYIDGRVVANPIGTGSTDLTKLEVGGTVYNIPSGGSGSAVYQHFITIDSYNQEADDYHYIQIIRYTSSATPITTLVSALSGYFIGWFTTGGNIEPFNSAIFESQFEITLYTCGVGSTFYPAEDATITDIVTQI